MKGLCNTYNTFGQEGKARTMKTGWVDHISLDLLMCIFPFLSIFFFSFSRSLPQAP